MRFSRRCCGCLSYATDWPAGFGIGNEWEQVAGEWSHSASGYVLTTDDDALLLHTREWPDNITYGVTARNIRYGVRAIFGYADADNYLFVERLTSGRTVLVSRVAGIEEILASAPQLDPASNGDALLTSPSASHADSFLFCYQGDVLAVHWDGGAIATTTPPSWSSSAWHGAVVASLPGNRVGFGTNTITPVGSEARFSPVVVYEAASDSKPDCFSCVDLCCDGRVPPDLTLTVEGTYSSNTPSYPAEATAAAQIAGSYTITNNTGYDCFWQYVYGGGPNNWSLIKVGDVLTLQLYHGNIRNAFGGAVPVALQFSASGVNERCVEWDSDIELTLDFAHVATADSPRALVRLP